MTRTTSLRLLYLLFLPAAALLILALAQSGGDGDSMAGEQGAPRTEAGSVADSARFANENGAPVAPRPIEGLEAIEPTPAPPDLASALLAQPTGQVSGRVLDAAQRPVGGEPVYLLRRSDPWRAGLAESREPTAAERLVAGVVTGGDGGFALPASAGAEYELLAGGGQWPRRALSDVQAGDTLQIVLPESFVLEGQVVERDSGLPLGGVPVLALAPDRALLATTDAEGRFTMQPLPETVWVVGSWTPGSGYGLVTEVLPALGPVRVELPPGREIVGRVVDGESGESVTPTSLRFRIDLEAELLGADALPGLQVVHDELVATEGGSFRIASGPSTGFTLEVEAEGYLPERYDRYEQRELGEDDEIEISLRKVPPVTGRVVVADGGAPLADATLSLSGPQGPVAEGQSGADGGFSLLPAAWDGRGPLWLQATAGALGARLKLGKSTEDLLLQLVPQVELLVRAELAGAPQPQADVGVSSADALLSVARTGPDGTASIVHALAGPETTSLSVSARHGALQSLPVDVPLAEIVAGQPVVVALDGGEWMAGQVVDIYGRPVPSALVSVRQRTGEGAKQRSQARCDDEGRFRLGPLVAGQGWSLYVRAEEFRDLNLHEVYAGGDPLWLELQPVVRWEGAIMDVASGQPRKRWSGQLRVQVTEEGRTFMKGARDRVRDKPNVPGGFSVALSDPGRYELRFQADGTVPVTVGPIDFDGRTPPKWTDVRLFPAAMLVVEVLDGRGRPVSGYEVAAIPWEHAAQAEFPAGEVRKQGRTERTDGAGLAEFNLGEGGAFRVAGGPSLWLDGAMLNVAPGPAVRRSYHLPATGDLEVSLSDENGRPLTGVYVELRSHRNEKGFDLTRRQSLRGEASTALFESLPPGDYTLTLRRRNYTTLRKDVAVPANATRREQIALQPRAKEQAQAVNNALKQLGYLR